MTRIQRTAAKSAAGKGSYTFAFTARPFSEKTRPMELAKCTEVSGSAIIKVPNTLNLCVGLAVTGTGIPAATTIKEVGHEGATLKPNELELNNKATESGEFTLKFTEPAGGFKTLGGKEGTETAENQYLILNQLCAAAENTRGTFFTTELLIPKKLWSGEVFGFRSAIQVGTILKLTSVKEPGNEALTITAEEVEERANGLLYVKAKTSPIGHPVGHVFEGSIAAGELGVVKEITNFTNLVPGGLIVGTEAISAEQTTVVQSVNEAAKTAVILPAAKEEFKKGNMTAFQPWPTGNEEVLITTEFGTHVPPSELAEYAKLAGRSTTQELAGAETKAEAEAKAFNIVPYASSTAQLRLKAEEVVLAAFTNGMEITAGGLKLTGSGKLEVAGGESLLGGTSKTTGVSLTQLAFTRVSSPGEIKENVKDYEAPNNTPTVWFRLKAKLNQGAIFGVEHKELAEGKIFVFTNVGINPIDLASECTGCPTATDRFKLIGTEKSSKFEATIAAGALTELKEITNFRFLYPGSKVTDTGGVIKAGTTITEIKISEKTAILSEAATGEHAKEEMTTTYAKVLTIEPEQSVWIIYDAKAGSERWRVIGGPSG